jgi:hypothetical protein
MKSSNELNDNAHRQDESRSIALLGSFSFYKRFKNPYIQALVFGITCSFWFGLLPYLFFQLGNK